MILLENDEVKIHGTKSDLDGCAGVVCGKVSEYPGGAIYVVRLANEMRPKLKKMGYHYSCVGLPDACLERFV